jgi:hypothetical protein
MMQFITLTYSIIAFVFVQQDSVQTQNFVQPRPLARGIADIQSRIQADKRLASSLEEAVQDHVAKFGEILYGTYGQEGDPAVKLLNLKEAYDSVHSVVENGITGQVWPAVGQLGQAVLDFWSEASPSVNNINAFQQMTLEGLRLRTTLSELNGYREQISRDTNILQTLEQKSADMAAQQDTERADSGSDVTAQLTTDLVPPTFPPDVDLKALDDAILLGRWLDLGNRAFKNQTDESEFYQKFPNLQQFRTIAEIRSPRTEVEALAVGSTGPRVRAPGNAVKRNCDHDPSVIAACTPPCSYGPGGRQCAYYSPEGLARECAAAKQRCSEKP